MGHAGRVYYQLLVPQLWIWRRAFAVLVVLFVNSSSSAHRDCLKALISLPWLNGSQAASLTQPVLSRSQWVRLVFMGFLVAVGYTVIEAASIQAGASDTLAATLGFVVFALLNIAFGLSARSEFETVFQSRQSRRPAPARSVWACAAAHIPCHRAEFLTKQPGHNFLTATNG